MPDSVVSGKRNPRLDNSCKLRNCVGVMKKPNLAALLKDRGLRLIDVARALRVDKSLPTRWAQNGIPHDRVLDVERVTGIPRQVLRPDLAKIFGEVA